MSAIEELLALHIRAAKLPAPEREIVFHPARKWRLDFGWPNNGMVALECDGGVYSGGRHTRGAGYTEDCRKINAAHLLGWRVFRVTGEMVKSGEAIKLLEEVLNVTS